MTLQKVFIANVDTVLQPTPGAPVTGSLARKVREISARFTLLGGEHDIIVLPEQPSRDYLDYLRQVLPKVPEVVVPCDLDLDRLTIRDGFKDPKMQRLVRGAIIESYIHDPLLKELIERYGGTYPMGAPESIRAINDKSQYPSFVDGLVAVPRGVHAEGIDSVARLVASRLRRGQDTMVRLVLSGGGLGNRLLRASEWSSSGLEAIVRELEGDQPMSWRDGVARIEEVLDLRWSPGVAFHTGRGVLYDFLQVTANKDYVGAWVPTPDWVVEPQQLTDIGEELAKRADEAGYVGSADTDLGVGENDQLYGFEINGRKDGVLHLVRAAEALTALPYAQWREEGIVIKGVDHIELGEPASFEQIHARLAQVDLLASRERLPGVVITIPPNLEGVFGLLVIGNDGNYGAVEDTYQRALATLSAKGPVEDNPLITG